MASNRALQSIVEKSAENGDKVDDKAAERDKNVGLFQQNQIRTMRVKNHVLDGIDGSWIADEAERLVRLPSVMSPQRSLPVWLRAQACRD